MKITAIILFASIMSVSAVTFGQKITLSEKQASLEKILTKIRLQSGFDFVYNSKLIKNAKPIDVNVSNVSLEEALNICLANQQLSFQIEEQTVLINKKEPSFIENIIARFQAIDVRGKVVDEKGEPLIGASVTVKGTSQATLSDKDGRFTLLKVKEEAVLVITYTGYAPKEVNATSDAITVALELSTSKLDEVQVIAYGTTTQRLNTGNVTTVKADVIEKQPVNNVLMALQGLVPGLSITQNTGIPGGSFTVRLRGENSLSTNGGDLLYVIDGVPYDSQLPASPINSFSLGAGSPLNYINPQDIESVSVLKDADATSIYGSRGANGVILITTKKGSAGSMSFDANVYSGFTAVREGVKMLNTQQYLEMRNEAFRNDGRIPGLSDYDLNGTWDKNRYTDWQKVLKNKAASFTNAQASISGGSSSTQYLISGNYSKQTTGFPTIRDDQGGNNNGSIHFSINSSSVDQKLKIALTGGYLVNKNTVINDLSFTAIKLSPNAPAIFNSDGSLNWAPRTQGQVGTWVNPYASLYENISSKTGNLISSFNISYMVIPGLEIKSNFGYTSTLSDEQYQAPASSLDPGYNIESGSTIFQNSKSQSWIVEPQINYQFKVGNSNFSFLSGATFNVTRNSSQNLIGQNFPSDALLGNIAAAGSISPTTTDNQYKYNAIFGRINYNYDGKYILNANIRRDGSSRFGPDKQFHTFYSIGGAWVFTEEKFIKENLSFLSFGKLRSSYGSSGSDGIGNYQFLDLYRPINSSGLNTYQGGAIGLYPTNLYNADVAWQESSKFEGAVDLGIFKDRLILSASYYHNLSGNQLVTAPVSATTGFFSVQSNLPAVIRNSGFELSLQSINVKTSNFRWTSAFNISLNRNKLVSFPGLEQSAYNNSLVIGKPLGLTKIYRFAGVNSATGLYQFFTANGSLTSSPSPVTDRTTIVDITPQYIGGWQNQLRYRSVSLDLSFQFVKQMGRNIFGVYSAMPGTKLNQPAFTLERWQKPGDIAIYQKFSQTSFGPTNVAQNIASISDRVFSDASFIRLKNVHLSWEMPKGFAQKAHFKSVKVYVQGQNLLTITRYKGFDPENQSATTLPPIIVWTAGLQFSL